MTIIFILIISCSIPSTAQQVYFSNRYDHNNKQEVIWSVLEVDSGYLCAVGTGKVVLMNLDKWGNVKWEKEYGSNNYYYYVAASGSMIQTYDGGYAVNGGRDSGTNASNVGILWRFDANGDILWTKSFGSTTNYFETFYQCKQTPDSGFILIGATDAPAMGGNTDIWLVKTDQNGNLQWEKTYGGGGVEYGFIVIVTNDGGYLLSGYTNSFGAGDYDGWIIKTNDTGMVEWDKTYGDENSNGGFYLLQTSDGGYIASGAKYLYTLSNNFPQSKTYIMKLDGVGNIEWDKTYGPERYGGGGGPIFEFSDGTFISMCQTNNRKGTPFGNGWPMGAILKINLQGDSIWYRTHEYDTCAKNDDYFRDMKPTSDGGYIVAGFFTPNTSFQCNDTGTQDMWVVKLDSCGCAWLGCDSACQGLVAINEKYKMINDKLKIKPNPTTGKFIFEIHSVKEEEKPYQMKIYDILGNVIKELKTKSKKIEVDISEYRAGIYFIQVKNEKDYYHSRFAKY